MTGTGPTPRSEHEIRRPIMPEREQIEAVNRAAEEYGIDRDVAHILLARGGDHRRDQLFAAESEAVSLRAERDRLGEWINIEKGRQESIISRYMRELATSRADVERLTEEAANFEQLATRHYHEARELRGQLLAVKASVEQFAATHTEQPPILEGQFSLCHKCRYNWPCPTVTSLAAALAGDVPPPAETREADHNEAVAVLGWLVLRLGSHNPFTEHVQAFADRPVAASSPTPTLLEALGVSAEDQAAVRERLSADFDRIREAERRAASAGQSVVLGASSPTPTETAKRCACGFTDPVYKPPEVHHASCSFARRPPSTENTDEGGDER